MKDWKAKLESAYSFMLKYSKITVCAIMSTSDIDLPMQTLANFYKLEVL